MGNIIRSIQSLPTSIKTTKTKGFTILEVVVTAILATGIVSTALFVVNNQREEVLTTQGRTQGTQNLRASLDLMGTDIQLAGELLESNRDLPVIQLINASGSANTPEGHDQLVVQRRLLAATLQTCEALGDNDNTITVSIPGEPCGFSDAGPDTDGDETIPNPDGLHDILNEFKDYRCEDAGPGECNRLGAGPVTAAQCVSDANDNNGCVVAYIVDPNTGFGEFFYYTNEFCEGACADHINGVAGAAITNKISAIPLENVDGTGSGQDWNHPSAVYPIGSRIYILEERHYRLDPPSGNDSGVLEMVLNNEEDYAVPSAAPNKGKALRLINKIESLNIEMEIVPTNGIAQTVTTFNAVVNPLPAPSLYDYGLQEARSIQLYLESSNPSNSDVVTLPKGGCNFPPFNTVAPYNGGDSVPGLCIAAKYLPRNTFSR